MATMTMTQSSISSRQHKLRTYVVLTAKSSRPRLPSFTDVLDDSSSSMPKLPDECIAYESYAAVASRFQASSRAATSPTRDLRWSDIARPRLYVASYLPNSAAVTKPRSQKARKRLQRRGGSSTVSNDHLELHALELSFEFLDLADLHRATAVCTEFKHAIRHSGRLISTLYARKWRDATAPPMSVAYDAVGFATVLAMYQQRRNDSAMQVSTRSQVTVQSDATVHVKNNSLLRVLSRGAIDSVRGSQALAVLPCARALGKQVTYFEVAMKGTGSVGVVSVSDAPTRSAYGYGSDEHVGWKGVSFGYHANDGDFVYNDGTAPYGGEWTPFGPAWGRMNTCADDDATTFVVGCGLDMASRRVFFTLNGTFVGFAPVVVPEGDYAAAVSLHEFNDSAVLNGGSAPFRYDIEGFCASL